MKLLHSLGYGLSTLVIYLGVTLLGWGLGHLGEFFSSAPRLLYAVIAGLFALAIGVQMKRPCSSRNLASVGRSTAVTPGDCYPTSSRLGPGCLITR
jgi:hypothetical protein